MSTSSSTTGGLTLRALAGPARLYALTRIGIGAWLFVDPAGFGAKWFAPPQDPLLTGSIIRASGGTDLAIGVGLLFADKPRRWLWLCAVCDFLDAFVVFLARSRFSDQELWSGIIGATGYGLIAVAIAELGGRRRRKSALS